MRNLRKLYPFGLIILGSFLEIWYYTFNFTTAGTDLVVALIIACTLTLLLTFMATKYKNWKAWLIIIPLALFSIFITSSGQTSYLQNKTIEISVSESQELNRQEQASEFKKDIIRLNNEYDLLETQKSKTITSLADRYRWKNTLAKAEARQELIKLEKIILSDKLELLRNDLTTNIEIKTERKNIYDFNFELFGINKKWLQYIIQTILSFFIAIAAPIGIASLGVKAIIDKPMKYMQISPQKVRTFINVSWMYKRKNKGPKEFIVPKNAFFRWVEKKHAENLDYPLFTKKEYAHLFNLIVNHNFIDPNSRIIFNGSETEIIEKLLLNVK